MAGAPAGDVDCHVAKGIPLRFCEAPDSRGGPLKQSPCVVVNGGAAELVGHDHSRLNVAQALGVFTGRPITAPSHVVDDDGGFAQRLIIHGTATLFGKKL